MRNLEKPDEIDFALIAHLQKNARLSNKELAAKVGLSQSACHKRLRNLESRGVLRAFHVDVDPKLMGVGLQALIAVRLDEHEREAIDEFHDYVMGLAEVIALYHVTGPNDYLIHIGARDSDHLRDIVLDRFTNRPEISHVETSLVFEYLRKPQTPRYADPS
jgi:DNA-binding Lrp family transcriptional regulator